MVRIHAIWVGKHGPIMGLVFKGERDELWVRLWDTFLGPRKGIGRNWGLVQRRKKSSPIVRVFSVTCKGLFDHHHHLFCVMSNESPFCLWGDVAGGNEATIDFTPWDLV